MLFSDIPTELASTFPGIKFIDGPKKAYFRWVDGKAVDVLPGERVEVRDPGTGQYVPESGFDGTEVKHKTYTLGKEKPEGEQGTIVSGLTEQEAAELMFLYLGNLFVTERASHVVWRVRPEYKVWGKSMKHEHPIIGLPDDEYQVAGIYSRFAIIKE